eukprot:m.114864 g.114864  ORF g.114864 m.114864 type:complete len:76 (+) comp37521_c0_seq2:275-502(+)
MKWKSHCTPQHQSKHHQANTNNDEINIIDPDTAKSINLNQVATTPDFNRSTSASKSANNTNQLSYLLAKQSRASS